MHLGNGAITPECAAITLGAAALGLGAAAVAARRQLRGQQPLSRQQLMLAAGLGALAFAAQAINVQVLPGTSAHLVGGVLLAWVLGPGLGAWTMAIILTVQALALGDGGFAAWGANVLNMAILPALCVAVCRRMNVTRGGWSQVTCAVAAAISVPIAALLIVGETALFRSATELVGWQEFAARMVATHLWIGIVEGGLTLAAVSAIVWMGQASWRSACASLFVAVILVVVALPLASPLPDGYEAAAAAAGLADWLAEGTDALASLQAAVVRAIQSVALNEQGCILAATLCAGILIYAFVAVVGPRRALAAE